MKKYFLVVFSIILVLSGLAILRAQDQNQASISETLMGTPTRIFVKGPHASLILNKAVQKFHLLENALYQDNPNSETALINQNSGIAAVAVTEDTFNLAKKSVMSARLTRGAFNPVYGALIDLWKASEARNEPPTKAELRSALNLCDWSLIQTDPTLKTVKLLRSGMKLNFDGIGKGYAVNLAIEMFAKAKMKSAMVDMGSSIGVYGNPPRPENPYLTGAPVTGPIASSETYWKIGVTDPRNPGKILGSVLLVSGQTLSTSGGYRQHYTIKGQEYNHIFDSTGQPANGCLSATIVCYDAALADALSTAVFALGPWKGMDLIRSISNVEALIVKADGNLVTTPGLRFESEK